MPESTPDNLKKKIKERLRYYEDLGIRLFYKDRAGGQHISVSAEPNAVAPSTIVLDEEISLRKTALQAKTEKVVKPVAAPMLTPPGALFAEVEKSKTIPC